MPTIAEMLKEMEERSKKPAAARPASAPPPARPPSEPTTTAPRVETHEVYELHATVVVRARVFSKTSAADLALQLRSLSIKIASYALRKFGLEVEVTWDSPRRIRRERIEVQD